MLNKLVSLIKKIYIMRSKNPNSYTNNFKCKQK